MAGWQWFADRRGRVTLVLPRQAVITGAPGAGKTTLLNAAAAAGIRTSPEVARQLLQSPGGMALRESDPLGFAEAMLEAHMREFERHADHGKPVLFDRGFPDVVGFLDVSGLTVPKPMFGSRQRFAVVRYMQLLECSTSTG